MLEEIRLWSMERMFNMSAKGHDWQFKICPAIRVLIDELKLQQRFWQVIPCGPNKFETRSMGEAFAVDLDKKECTCRMWQLNGYGCVHSVATISYHNRPMEPFVDPILLGNFFQNTYKYHLQPMNGSDMWPSTEYIPPLPPMKRRMPGRPQVKRRRNGSEKIGNYKVSRVGKKIVCGNCKQPGHNKATCTQVSKPDKLNVKKKVPAEGSCSGVKDAEGGDTNGVNVDGSASRVKVSKRRVTKGVNVVGGSKVDGSSSGVKADKRRVTGGVKDVSGVKKKQKVQGSSADGKKATKRKNVAVNEDIPTVEAAAHQPPAEEEALQVVVQVLQAQHEALQIVDALHEEEAVAEALQIADAVQQIQPKGKPKPKRSARIVKMKLARKVQGKNGEGNTDASPMEID